MDNRNDVIGKKFLDLYPSCALTRAMARKSIHETAYKTVKKAHKAVKSDNFTSTLARIEWQHVELLPFRERE